MNDHGPPYRARRSPVLGRRGMVACSQPLAAEAGLRILKDGGNAIDAAVAVAAALAVTEPCSTGLGGDAFCLYYDAASRSVEGLNASGRAPSALSLEAAQAAAVAAATDNHGGDGLPPLHAHCITVPGAAAGWVDSLEKWGSGMSLADILQPAIELARDGFPVSPITAHNWANGVKVLKHHGSAGAAEELLVGGMRAPRAGEIFRNPGMAATLTLLAQGGKEAFYAGPVAEAIVTAVTAAGGVMTSSDLASHVSTFPAPISTDYKGVRVWEIPPNGQGLTALLALNTVARLCETPGALDALAQQAKTTAEPVSPYCSVPVPSVPPTQSLAQLGHNSAPYLHTLIEATRLAFADSRWYVADSDKMHVPVAELLSREYGQARAGLIQPYAAAADVQRGSPVAGTDTVSFQVVDGQGNAASFINSNYMGFGSGLVPKGCGFSLQNRGAGFSLQPGHPNVLAPGKRPYHTIIPGLATWADDGSLFCTFSNMGGFMQPQGHLQLMCNMIDFSGCDPQTAIDLPRFCIGDGTAGGAVSLEDGISEEVIADLTARGHNIARESPLRGWYRSLFGRAQIIYRDRVSGVLWAGSDGRGDGCAMGW